MALLFEKHHLALQYLVPNLLKLYVDIEFTGSHTQLFAEAAGVMRQIGRLPEQTVQEFKLLGVKAKAAATEARDKEALLGEIPGVP
jgi:ATP-dependent phosphoenolpyruvate carboxykinase